MSCYLTQDIIITTRSWNEVDMMRRLLRVHVGMADYDQEWIWLIIFTEPCYVIEGFRAEESKGISLSEVRKIYPLLPVYTFQGFKHHFVK